MQSTVGSLLHRLRYPIVAASLVALAGLFFSASTPAPGVLAATVNLYGSPMGQPANGFPWTEQGIALYRGDSVSGRPALTTETSATGQMTVRLPPGTYALGPWPVIGGTFC